MPDAGRSRIHYQVICFQEIVSQNRISTLPNKKSQEKLWEEEVLSTKERLILRSAPVLIWPPFALLRGGAEAEKNVGPGSILTDAPESTK